MSDLEILADALAQAGQWGINSTRTDVGHEMSRLFYELGIAINAGIAERDRRAKESVEAMMRDGVTKEG